MKVFVFDMDGVLVDTTGSLFNRYLDFLKGFGKEGSKIEFDILNGPRLPEIVAYLKEKYDLGMSEKELLAIYQKKMAGVYDDPKLISGVREVLKAIQDNRFKIALASSAPRSAVDKVLPRLDVEFDVIVSGDDVKEAKPSPEIYEAVKKKLKGEFVVIEDATNGIESALAAGMEVIAFRNQHEKAKFEIDDMGELIDIVNGYRVFRGNIELELVEHEVSSEEADRTWEENKKNNPDMFDGKMLAYHDHAIEDGTIRIWCFLSSYRFFSAGLISPLSVSGITIDKQGKILVGRRGRVTEYADRDELVPSGSLEHTDYKAQILKELKEEAGITNGTVQILGLIHDIDHDVYDIACRIQVDRLDPQITAEYSRFSIAESLDGLDLIPTSIALKSLV
ncbi:HAD-IA family hydrolase [Gemmatimonadota bacterium]